MTLYTSRAIIIVSAADQAAANAAAKAVDRVGGEFTFTVGLSASGVEPWSHYICNWQMTPAERTALEAEFTRRGVTADIRDCDTWDSAVALPRAETVLTDRGLKTREATFEAESTFETAKLAVRAGLSAPVEVPPSRRVVSWRPSWWRRFLHWLSRILAWLRKRFQN